MCLPSCCFGHFAQYQEALSQQSFQSQFLRHQVLPAATKLGVLLNTALLLWCSKATRTCELQVVLSHNPKSDEQSHPQQRQEAREEHCQHLKDSDRMTSEAAAKLEKRDVTILS